MIPFFKSKANLHLGLSRVSGGDPILLYVFTRRFLSFPRQRGDPQTAAIELGLLPSFPRKRG